MGSEVLLFLLLAVWAAYCEPNNDDCQIGGYRLPNGTCVCHRYWHDSDSGRCEKIACLNGGYSHNGTVYCNCPTGYLGPHCDPVMLSPAPASVFGKQSTFNLVIYNAFTDYWGKAGYAHLQESVNRHIGNFRYAKYNMAVYRDGNNPSDQYVQFNSVSNVTFLQRLKDETSLYPSTYGCVNLPFYRPMYTFLTDRNLRDTAVTIITQFPPADDDLYREKLQELAVAFNIRINVIWISDETFIRCFFDGKVNPQYERLKDLAFTTGGLFVPQKYAPNDEPQYTDVVISSHYQYQPLALGTSTDCTEPVTVSWQTSQTDTYVITEGDITSTYECTLQPLNGSLSNGQLIFLVTNTTGNECTLTLSNPGASCSARIFASDYNNTGLRLYSSFVEDANIDSSKYQPTIGNAFYFVVHAEKNGANFKDIQVTKTVFFMDNGVKQNMDMVSRSSPAAFDMITKEPITCNTTDSKLLWAEVYLSVSVNSSLKTEKRYVTFKCFDGYKQPITTTTATTTTATTAAPTYSGSTATVSSQTSTVSTSTSSGTISTSASTTATPTSTSISTSSYTLSTTGTVTSTATTTASTSTTTSASPTTTTIPAPVNFPIDNPITFAYGFANTMPYAFYEVFAVTTLNNVNVNAFGYFGVVRFEVVNETDVAYHPENNITSFRTAVYNEYGYATVPGTAQSISSQILDALTSVASSDKVYENSLIVFCLDKLPRSAEYKQYATLVSKNVKTVFLIDKGSLSRELSLSRTAAPLNEIAAASNGHFIVSDQGNATNFIELLNMLYASGPSQSLLFARSMRYVATETSLGSLEIGENLQVTITATTSVYDSLDLGDAKMIVTFESSSDKIIVPLEHTDKSNFFSGIATLKPDQFNVYVNMTYDVGKDVHVRMWIPRTDRKLKVQYVDLDMKQLSTGPDTVNGAAARVTIFGGTPGTNLSMDIRDCGGNEVKLYDAKQWQLVTDTGDAYFIPFFCVDNSSTSAQCAAGTQNKYHVQYTSSDGLSEMRSFVCTKSTVESAVNCRQTNSKGDFECSQSRSPFNRGPTGKLRDCSDKGQLIYDMSKRSYICECDPGFSGESCEIGICPHSNASTEGVDVQYRTYTVIIGVDSDNYGLEGLLLGDASDMVSVEAEPSTIWRYQLILYCDNKIAVPVYIGGSYEEFNKAMKSNAFCTAPKRQPFDMVDVFQTAVNGLGRLVRGLIVFYTEKQADMQVNLERFISVSRNYRQEMYLIAVDETSGQLAYDDFTDLRAAVLATGGNILFVDSSPPGISVFSDMISSVTSLALLAPTQVGNAPVAVDPGATGYVFLSYRGANLAKVTRDDGTALTPLVVTGRYSAVYKLGGASKYVVSGINSYDYSASAVILNGIAPSFTIINERTDDEWTAFATPDYVTGPSIAFTLPSGWQVLSSTDANYRVSSRQACTFGYSAFSVFPAMSAGANFVTVTLSDGTTTVNRVVPVAVTSSMVCQNNGTAGVTSCSCTSDFTMPDCSRPICQNGELNTWGDVCDCYWNSAGGRLCGWKSTM